MRVRSQTRQRGRSRGPAAAALLGCGSLLALVMLVACGGAPAAGPATEPGAPARPTSVVLTVLHTGDWHGHAFPDAGPDGTLRGGVIAAAAAVARVRAERPGAVLVLDAGDLLSGPPVVGLSDAGGVRGAPFVRFWEAIQYDAFALGNHEFDHGRTNLLALLAQIETPALCANLLATAPQAPPAQAAAAGAAPAPPAPALPVAPYLVLERAGLRVAVIGLITSELEGLVDREALAGMRLVPAAEALRRLMPELERISDLQLVLTHCGIEEDTELARSVPGIDAILGGHSHLRLEQPRVVAGVPICHAGAHGRELGRLELTLEPPGAPGAGEATGRGWRVRGFAYRLLPLVRTAEAERRVPGALLVAERELREQVAGLEREVVGALEQRLGREHHADSALGGAVAEALRAAAAADLGAINSGGLRADLGPGPVTRAQLITALPFGNPVVVLELRGSELLEVLAHNARAAATRSHGILQTAGVVCRYAVEPEGSVRLLAAEVGGRPVDPERTYRLATNSYVAFSQARKYLGLEPARERAHELRLTVREAVEQALVAGRLLPPAAPRLVRAQPAEPAGVGR